MNRIYPAFLAPLAAGSAETADRLQILSEGFSLLIQIIIAITALISLYKNWKESR